MNKYLLNLKKVIPSWSEIEWKIFFYFSIFALIPLIYIRFYIYIREEQFLYVFINSLLFMAPIFTGKLKKLTYIYIVGGILFIFNLISLLFATVFKNTIGKHIFYIIFNTNKAEAAEFMGDYFSLGSVFVILGYLMLFVLISKYLFKNVKTLPSKFQLNSLITLVLLPLVLTYAQNNFNISEASHRYTKSNVPLFFFKTYAEYTRHIRLIQKANAFEEKIEVQRAISPEVPETHVLVLGESQNTTHMSLYGYHRKTNPKLEALRPELAVFDKVQCINPPTTDINIVRILTFLEGHEDDDLLWQKHSIIQIMKNAGFKTYWLSNQGSVGVRITTITAVGNSSDVKAYTSSENKFNLDDRIFPVLDRYLADNNTKKKFIIIHINGSHNTYSHRYPKEFDHFKSTDDLVKKPFHNKAKLQIINEYDNATLYNDTIITEIINRLKKLNHASSLLYLSDHGEEVFETLDQMGHGSAGKTKGGFSIPFMIWPSKQFQKLRNINLEHLQSLSQRSYTSDLTIHTLMDLYGIESSEFQSEKSILSNRYQKVRIINF